MLGAELATADDLGAELATADDLGAELATAEDVVLDGDTEPPAAPVSEAVLDGVFEVDATPITTSAPNAMSAESILCRAGQDLRLRPFGVCGGMADCCHDGDWSASC